MAVFFPTQSGTACLHTASNITSPNDISIYFWYRGENDGSFTFRSIAYLGPGAAVDGFDLFFQGSGTNKFKFQRRYSGTDGDWELQSTNYGVAPSSSLWRWFGISLSGTGPPTIYHSSLDDPAPVSRTVTTVSTPTGTPDAGGSNQLHIGNWEAHDGSFVGDLACFGLHSAALSTDEMKGAMWYGPPSSGLLYASRLDHDTPASSADLSGNGRTLTANGSPEHIELMPPGVWEPVRPDYSRFSKPKLVRA